MHLVPHEDTLLKSPSSGRSLPSQDITGTFSLGGIITVKPALHARLSVLPYSSEHQLGGRCMASSMVHGINPVEILKDSISDIKRSFDHLRTSPITSSSNSSNAKFLG
jgi:hypothetical protein